MPLVENPTKILWLPRSTFASESNVFPNPRWSRAVGGDDNGHRPRFFSHGHSAAAFHSERRAFGLGQPAECRQGLTNDLIHIVVSVGAEPADEDDVVALTRQSFIPLVQSLVLRPRNRIVWFPLGLGNSYEMLVLACVWPVRCLYSVIRVKGISSAG